MLPVLGVKAAIRTV